MGRRGQTSIVFACGVDVSNIPGSNPGPACPFASSEKTETHIPCMRVACNGQQYGVVNTYMLVTCLSKMILTAISHAIGTVRRVSRSAVYYTHQTNSLPLSKP